jgi:hypothetical protein
MVGGVIRLFFDKMKKEEKEKEEIITDGVLYCSGMIAGEGLVGILLAVFAVVGIDSALDLSGLLKFPAMVSDILSLGVFALVILCLLKFTIWKKRAKKA